MPNLTDLLEIDRCPHCSISIPKMNTRANFKTTEYTGLNIRVWKAYACSSCGGAVLAFSTALDQPIIEMYPEVTLIDEAIPEPARSYLIQAIESLHTPAGSVMLSASAVDAMLKKKNYTKGSLYTRIEKAAEEHLITDEMAKWAHEVRLDSNEPRHADVNKPLPTKAEAKGSVDFVLALGEFIFVLPSRVKRGLKNEEKEKIE